MGEFDGRLVVVTGGTGALGAAVVRTLLQRGARCAIPCIDPAERDRFDLRDDPRITITPGVDLTDQAAVEGFYARAAGAAEPLWASLHIAGGFAYSPVERADKAQFLAQIGMNALTCWLCCRQAIAHMPRGGRIVNIAARPALEPRAGARMVPYTAAKAAVAAITQALAEEVVARDILINAVAPSIMDTPANRAAMPDADHASWAKVEDVAAAIAFLASPLNRVARGGVIPVYGRA